MNYITKIAQSLKESGFLVKSASEAIKSGAKDQKEGFYVCYLVHYVIRYI